MILYLIFLFFQRLFSKLHYNLRINLKVHTIYLSEGLANYFSFTRLCRTTKTRQKVYSLSVSYILYSYKSVYCYSIIEATLPDPTVLPPSRIAKTRPCSIAIGLINSIVISTLSPGMHISTPSGKLHTPVTSVVLK